MITIIIIVAFGGYAAYIHNELKTAKSKIRELEFANENLLSQVQNIKDTKLIR